jgi:nuclear transport factor 2 (NTF2) superfamily protein
MLFFHHDDSGNWQQAIGSKAIRNEETGKRRRRKLQNTKYKLQTNYNSKITSYKQKRCPSGTFLTPSAKEKTGAVDSR